MWRRSVGNLYLQLNALGFVVAGICYFIMLSRTVSAFAIGLGSNELARETHVFNAVNFALAGASVPRRIDLISAMSFHHGTNLIIEFNILLSQVNLLTGLIFLLPFSLTLSMVWAAKDVALRRLAGIDVRA